MTMTYEHALEYIHSTQRFGSKLGLERMKTLTDALDKPQKKLKFVHVAGTNGKGSTTAMLTSILRAAGYRTGMYISPYVEDFRERIQLDGELISKEKLAEYTEHVMKAAAICKRVTGEDATEFELITALALDFFAGEGCDFAVLEVGLGGRFDATNIIDCPELSAIMAISLDHCGILGNTVEEIAFEKCGIIKQGGHVVMYPIQPGNVHAVIESECAKKNARLRVPDTSALAVELANGDGSVFVYNGVRYELNLAGRHIINNAITAIEGALELSRRWDITGTDIREGIKSTRFGGRLEHVRADPDCYIDAAHNPDAINAVSNALDTIFAGRPIVCIMGMFADKDYKYCIPEISGRAAKFIAVTPPSDRALPAEKTAEIASANCADVSCAENVGIAVKTAMDAAKNMDNPIVIALGSLSFIGEAKAAFFEGKGLPSA